jgi:phosphatidylglycerol---prolipoprotein diacylglyceryl transferase
MYPNLYYLIKDLFGLSIPFLKGISTVGFFMALAFLPGAWLWEYELKRKEKNGELTYIVKTIIVGKGANLKRVLLHFLLGFTGGFKLVGLIANQHFETNPDYFFSLQGNLPAGILCGSIWAIATFYIGQKQRLPATHKETIRVYPHEYVPHTVLVAALSGIIGAKVFGVLETWNAFVEDPVGTFFSSEGFAFLGGFIVATFAMWFYHHKFGVQRMRMADALAPSLMLSYSLGRLGCQISGDGDWGIMIFIQLFLTLLFKLYRAGRLIEYSLDKNLSSCGKVSFKELKISFDKFSLINRLSRLPPASIDK